MKNLFIALFILLFFSCALGNPKPPDLPDSLDHSESKYTGQEYYVIGKMIDIKETHDYLKKTGLLLTFPLPFKKSFIFLVNDGVLCKIYGHTFIDGKCKFCGVEE